MLNLLFFLIRISPLPLLYVFAWGLGWLFYALGVKQRRIGEVNLGLCFPEWSAQRRHRLCRRNMVETVKNLLESVKLWGSGQAETLALVRQVSGLSLLEQARDQGQGVILLIPHLGNWEMVNLYCSAKFPVTGLYRPQKSRSLDQIMRAGRVKFGCNALPADNSGVRGLLRALKQNHVVIILPDQNPGRGTGIFAPFFGVTTNSPVLPARLAQKTGAAVVFGYAERLPHGRGFHVHFCLGNADLAQPDLLAATAGMNADLERFVRLLPEQYWWGYARFRHRPEGEARLYEKD